MDIESALPRQDGPVRGRWKFLGLYAAALACVAVVAFYSGRLDPSQVKCLTGGAQAIGSAATGELIAKEVKAAMADPSVKERLQRIAEEVSAAPDFKDHMQRAVANMQAHLLDEHFQWRVAELGAHISNSLSPKGPDSWPSSSGVSSHFQRFVGAGLAVPTARAPGRAGAIGANMREASDGGRMGRAEMAGVTGPLGFWDPLGYSYSASEERFRFLREAELKNGRVAMLAALGFIVAEENPIFMKGIYRGPSIDTWTQIGLDGYFWPGVIFCIALPEVFSLFNHNNPFEYGEWRTHRTDIEPGSYAGFDPLGLKPKDPDEFDLMQSKELNNGRAAMIGIAGMIAQELVNHQKILETLQPFITMPARSPR